MGDTFSFTRVAAIAILNELCTMKWFVWSLGVSKNSYLGFVFKPVVPIKLSGVEVPSISDKWPV